MLTVTARVAALRAKQNELAAASDEPLEVRASRALDLFAQLWRERLASGWVPPPDDDGEGLPGFSWAMVRISLAGLVSSPCALSQYWGRAHGARRPSFVTALVLAGNTPLLAWPALWAALLAGSAVFVKQSSRSETLWPRLFVAALAEAADPDLATLVHRDGWPGEDARTAELVRAADAVIAYGSDASVAALRALTPPGTPFFGFGHALSVGLVLARADADDAAAGFARDVLLYDQGGCLSPQTVFVEGGAAQASAFGYALARALPGVAEALDVARSGDVSRAARVRRARDLALFTSGARVLADPDDLRWTVIVYETDGAEQAMLPPTGHGVVFVLPLANVAGGFGRALRPAAREHLSSVGVAGTLRPDVEEAIRAEGVSRVCKPSEMQAPPLDWPNGGRDLLRCLLDCRSDEATPWDT
jgi:hypothetical protein